VRAVIYLLFFCFIYYFDAFIAIRQTISLKFIETPCIKVDFHLLVWKREQAREQENGKGNTEINIVLSVVSGRRVRKLHNNLIGCLETINAIVHGKFYPQVIFIGMCYLNFSIKLQIFF